jgi:hypothetical protein
MPSDRPQNIYIPDRQQRLLFVNWIQNLIGDRLGQIQGSQGDFNSDAWTLHVADDREIQLEIKAPRFRVETRQPSRDRAAMRQIVTDAWQSTRAFNVGEGVWYKTRFTSQVPMIGPLAQLHFMRFLSEHTSRRPSGPIRLSNKVLLEFEQNQQDPNAPAVPSFAVDVTLLAPGPGRGPFAQFYAVNMATFIRAILAYSTAAPLDHPGMVLAFPAKQPDVDSALEKLLNPSVGELMVDGIVLYPRIEEFSSAEQQFAKLELLRRVQGGLYAYEQALHQESEYVALILLVAAIEALTVPNAGWKQERLAKRFREFVMQAAPAMIAEIMSDGNFGRAFGTYTSQNRFLNDVYNRRSQPLHTGFVQLAISPMIDIGHEGSLRVMLVSGLFRACLRSFLEMPFSSLVGHPSCTELDEASPDTEEQ